MLISQNTLRDITLYTIQAKSKSGTISNATVTIIRS